MPIQPKIEILSYDLIARILDEAFQLLQTVGVKVQSEEARQLLVAAGANHDQDVVRIPEGIVRAALQSVPETFHLYDRDGNAAVTYGGDSVHFDPGSSGVHILDPESLQHRPSETVDLIQLVKLAEQLPQFAAQSTAVVCNEIPKQIGDFYRLYQVLLYSKKPVVTGSFSITTLGTMIDMLGIFAGDRKALAEKPQAVFDVCPTPPLVWSEFGAENLIALARAGVPAQMVSMPLAGAAAPVTLLGAVVQHAAECLSGIAIHQLAHAGAPIVWGGAPAIFDMRSGTTPMGAIETAMIDAAYAQVGKSLNLPTHAYLGASDSKRVDAQAGMESGMTALIGALAGINMISGAGMLDFLACQSLEKLVIDAEGIAMTERLLEGIQLRTPTLALELFEGINFKGDFLRQKATRQLFQQEQWLPSNVIDRKSIRAWEDDGRLDAFARARLRVRDLLGSYERPALDLTKVDDLIRFVQDQARSFGVEALPRLPD